MHTSQSRFSFHILDRAIDWRAVDQARLDVVRAACREHGLAVTPTLSSSLGVLDLERHDAARLEASARALPRFFADIVWHPTHGIPAYRRMGPAEFGMAREAVGKKHRLVQQLFEDGVTVRLGTDTQQPFVAPGVSLHREMDAFVDAGIPRGAALDLASREAARALGLADVGRVVPGARAELIVSKQDARLSGWSPSHDLVATIARGQLVLARDVYHWLARFGVRRLARRFVS